MRNLLSPEQSGQRARPKEARMSARSTARNLPVRPNLDQLRRQARDLLRAIRRGDPSAIEEFNRSQP